MLIIDYLLFLQNWPYELLKEIIWMQMKGNLLILGKITPERVNAQQLKARGSILVMSEFLAISKQPELARNSVISTCVKKRRWEMARHESPQINFSLLT